MLGGFHMRINRGIFIILILALVSCAERGEYPIETEKIDGVQVIMNPDYPRDGKFHLTLDEELSMGDTEEEGQFFSSPSEICVSDDGTIFVYDSSLDQISCFDSSGNYLRTFARIGKGPGEFETLRFTLSRDDKIYAMDSLNARISVLDTEGNYIDGFSVLNLSGGWSKIYSDRINNIYVSKERRIENGYVYSIHRYDPQGNELHDYGEFPGDLFLWTKRGDTMSPSRSNASPATVWIVSRDGRLYAGYNDNYLINVYGRDGEMLFKFGRKFDPQPDTMNWLDGISDHLPVYSRTWRMDDAGNLWIELVSWKRDEDTTYDIFSPEGIYLKQVRTKHRILTIKNQKAYCVVPSDEDLPLVKRYLMIENADILR